jgi:serine protease Do
MSEPGSQGTSYYSPEPRYRPSWAQHLDEPTEPAAPVWDASPPGARPGGPRPGSPSPAPVAVGPLLAVAVLSAILGSGGTYLLLSSGGQLSHAATSSPLGAAASATPGTQPAAAQSAIVDAAATVSPAVVTITSVTNFDPNSSTVPQVGVGSGVIYDARGWILTNCHVVKGGSSLEVALQDGRSFSGQVYGIDTLTDLAIVKVEASGLPIAPIGDSSTLQPGEQVIAIGSPLGTYTNSVTSGIISALGRSILAQGPEGCNDNLHNLVQTDAAINFGNSGGALADTAAKVIGINTALASQAQGIGFAIPINIARSISKQLIATGKVTRGYLGILPQELTPELADNWGIQGSHGVLVGGVSTNTPASQAGFQVKDVITDFDGKPVDDVQRFRLLVAETPVNKRVSVRVLRNGRPRDLAVTLAERPPEDQVAKAETAQPSSSDWLGIQVSALGSDAAGEFNLHDKTGVVITDVTEGSGADDSGLRPGDVIKEVNDTAVKDMVEYTHAVDAARRKNPAKPVVFLIKRGDATQFVAVEPSQD